MLKVYLVGAGPGKPDLITVRGLNILKEADVIIYDYLANKGLLKHAKDEAELVRRDESDKDLLVRKAKEGKKVIRLKGGDPTIFSRCSEELEALVSNNIEFEIIPGVTAATAASSFNGIPLTSRDSASSCMFVTGRESPLKKRSLIDWNRAEKSGTIVLYMSVGNLEHIVKEMLKAGKDNNTAAAVIQNASLPGQRILTGTLKNIAAKAKRQKIKPPAIIIIGNTVKLEKKFNWMKKNKRVLFTGLSKERFFVDGTYFHLPLIKIEPVEDYGEFDGHLKNIRNFNWIVFASRYGVEYFFKRLECAGFDSRALYGIGVAAVGNSTSNRLSDFGISADLVPKIESSDGLMEEFKKVDLKGKKIFLPRSDISDKGLENALTALGALVTACFAYRNAMPNDLPDIDFSNFHEIIFTSPSTVKNFVKRYGKLPEQAKIKCIGDVTLKEAKRCKLAPKI